MRVLVTGGSAGSTVLGSAELYDPAQNAWSPAAPMYSLRASHTAAWAGLSSASDKLPKLLIRDKRILHGLPTGEADFIRVMENELGL